MPFHNGESLLYVDAAAADGDIGARQPERLLRVHLPISSKGVRSPGGARTLEEPAVAGSIEGWLAVWIARRCMADGQAGLV
jgi:hypothetical protein